MLLLVEGLASVGVEFVATASEFDARVALSIVVFPAFVRGLGLVLSAI
jgi:hypothetical protein